MVWFLNSEEVWVKLGRRKWNQCGALSKEVSPLMLRVPLSNPSKGKDIHSLRKSIGWLWLRHNQYCFRNVGISDGWRGRRVLIESRRLAQPLFAIFPLPTRTTTRRQTKHDKIRTLKDHALLQGRVGLSILFDTIRRGYWSNRGIWTSLPLKYSDWETIQNCTRG